MAVRLFCYGTLEFPQVMEAVIGRGCIGAPARVSGYACLKAKGRVYPGIVRAEGHVTPGTLYHGLSGAELRRLDRYEDPFYRRRLIRVADGRGRPLMAWAYIIPERNKAVLSDAAWDKDAFERLHLAGFLKRLR